MRRVLIGRSSTATNLAFADPTGLPHWELLAPDVALRELRPGDVALGRLDVLPTVDGVENGLWALGALAARGVRVLNHSSALLACHDKLLTARLLARAGLPHPRTRLVRPTDAALPSLSGGVVVKPRFGSMGQGVARCDGEHALGPLVRSLDGTGWFERHGALVQDIVPPLGYDLRVLVAGARVIGGVKRVSQDGEWRTNVALGARRVATSIPDDAQILALRAARELDVALVGVDLLPTADGWTILELNGAVEFTRAYNPTDDVFSVAKVELARHAEERPAPLTVCVDGTAQEDVPTSAQHRFA